MEHRNLGHFQPFSPSKHFSPQQKSQAFQNQSLQESSFLINKLLLDTKMEYETIQNITQKY